MPNEQGLEPGYEQRHFDDLDGGLRLVASQDGRGGSISLNADVDLYASRLAQGDQAQVPIRDGRGLWIQVNEGCVSVDDVKLEAGDGLALSGASGIHIAAEESGEFLLFDMAL